MSITHKIEKIVNNPALTPVIKEVLMAQVIKEDSGFMDRLMQKGRLYKEMEQCIMQWVIDGDKTAGTLTRQLMKIING